MSEFAVQRKDHHGLVLSMIFAAALGGCSENVSKPEGTSLSGAVEIEGTLTDADGVPFATAVAEQVTGLMVYLASDGVLVDSVATEFGSYLFEGVTPGTYEIVTWIVPAGVVSTGAFEIGDGFIYTAVPIPLTDPIVLVPSVFATVGPAPFVGDETGVVPTPGTPVDSLSLTVFPNPASSEQQVEYVLASDSMVDLRIEDVRKTPIRELVSMSQPAGRHRATWDGTDSQGEAVAPGLYIVTSYTETTEGWDLVLRIPEEAP